MGNGFGKNAGVSEVDIFYPRDSISGQIYSIDLVLTNKGKLLLQVGLHITEVGINLIKRCCQSYNQIILQ